MNFLEKLADWLETEPPEPPRPRDVTPQEREDWIKASDYGLFKSATPSNPEGLRKLIRSHNIVRWHRLRSDFRWAQKMARKEGLNPEDVRWLL